MLPMASQVFLYFFLYFFIYFFNFLIMLAPYGITGFYVRELARRAGVPIQEFAVRNDCPCGSTIGPIISQNTGTN